MEEGPRIVLPENEFRVNALRAKLGEYKERLEGLKQGEPCMHPQLFNTLNSHPVYKYLILERLLEGGEVDTQEFSLELKELHGFFDVGNYNDAVGVIADYCETGGRNISGGTGLQEVVLN